MVVVATGLADGMLIFVVASGLTLVLGVMGIVNFAHGGFFMLGAYLGYALMRGQPHSTVVFVLLVLAAAALTGIVGLLSERLVFRRMYDLPEVTSLLGTYALLLILEGIAQIIWGLNPKTQAEPATLDRTFHLLGAQVPRYDVLIFIAGVVVVIALELLLRRTEFGRQVTAVSEDRFMAGLLGINVARVFAITFAVGIGLAGLGGALAAPTVSLVPDVALDFILEAFAVVIVGGFGSITGSLIAALALGLLNSWLSQDVPSLAGFSLYLLMALVLVLRPQGLIGEAPLLEADA